MVSLSSNIDQSTPAFVSLASIFGMLGGGMLVAVTADAFRIRDSAGLAVLLLAGGIAGGVAVYTALMRMVGRHRIREAAAKKNEQRRLREAYELKHTEALGAARKAFPQCIDEHSLRDPEGPYAWPDELFERLFRVPDAVVSFESAGKHGGEVRMWSRELVGTNSQDDDYVQYIKRVHERRREQGEARRKKEEEQRLAAEEEQLAAEEARAEAEKLALRQQQQVIVDLEELKRRVN